MRTLLIISLATILCSCNSTDNKNAENQKKDFSALITTNNGKVTHLTNFCRKSVYRAWYPTIKTNVPTQNEIISYDIFLDTGPFIIIIPFDIIDSLQLNVKKIKYSSYNILKVYLGNNTTLTGTLAGSISQVFSGTTEIGETRIHEKDIQSIVIEHKAESKFQAASFGSHNVIINTVENEKIEVSDASFLNRKLNENGVYLANEVTDKFEFKEKNGSDYKIHWDKIKMIIHKDPEVILGNSFTSDHPFTLITKIGDTYFGSCPNSSSNNIKGIALINKSYYLQIKIPLYRNTYNSIEFLN